MTSEEIARLAQIFAPGTEKIRLTASRCRAATSALIEMLAHVKGTRLTMTTNGP
jgi:molybdenum cofactor biosynthesis enzyme MoaA